MPDGGSSRYNNPAAGKFLKNKLGIHYFNDHCRLLIEIHIKATIAFLWMIISMTCQRALSIH